ncbi:Nuclear aminoacylation-dependent tRNA export pathway component [Batrachochytrium dendrobatidis]
MTSFVLDFAKSTLSKALGSQQPNLLFSIGLPTSQQPEESLWVLHTGIKKDDQQPVSVFIFDCNLHRDKLDLAQNALRRAKTIRYPDILRYIDGCETETQIIIGTESVTPLIHDQSKLQDANLVSLGLFKLASALKFLTQDCALIYANVRLTSIFSTQSGEWKLGGLDFLSSLKDENPPIFRHAIMISSQEHTIPPEVVKSSTSVLASQPITSLDIWGFSCLIHDIFNGQTGLGSIPSSMMSLCQKMRHINPKLRPTFDQVLKSAQDKGGYFDNDFVKTSLFLEQFSLKDPHEKNAYFNTINTSVVLFPLEFCKYKILPELINALEFGGADAKALGPILKIGSRLDESAFGTLIVPIITKLFASSDRSIRVTLCESLGSYIGHLSQKIVSEKIFPNLATGFGDTSATVRESTLKSVLVIAPKLSERIINNDILRYLAKLQADEEPGIRTNTTICLGKISIYMSDSIKKKILSTAFIRSLHDRFPPARKAGLMALAATIDCYNPSEIAQKIIPSISPLILDQEKVNRVQALKNMSLFIKKLESAAEEMPESAVQAVPKEAETSSNSPSTGGGANDGWAGWAISAMSSRIATSMSIYDTKPDGTSASSILDPTSDEKNVKTLTPSTTFAATDSFKFDTDAGNTTAGAFANPHLESALAAETTNGWDDSGWDIDESMQPKSPVQDPTKMVSPTNAASKDWDSWSDNWSSQPISMGSKPVSSFSNTNLKSTTASSNREEERQKRREALLAQREARKAARLGTKLTEL